MYGYEQKHPGACSTSFATGYECTPRKRSAKKWVLLEFVLFMFIVLLKSTPREHDLAVREKVIFPKP